MIDIENHNKRIKQQDVIATAVSTVQRSNGAIPWGLLLTTSYNSIVVVNECAHALNVTRLLEINIIVIVNGYEKMAGNNRKKKRYNNKVENNKSVEKYLHNCDEYGAHVER